MIRTTRTLAACALAALALVALPDPAHATTIAVGNQIRLYDGPGGNGGGEFYADVTPLNAPAASTPYDFITFCLQRNEYFSWGDTMYIGGIATQTNDGDALDPRTAYLYSRFASNSLAGYTYAPGAGRAASATALQLAIWYLEGEVTYNGSAFLDAYNNASLGSNALAWTFINAATNAAWVTTGNVKVLNLYGSYDPYAKRYSGNRQDQLALIDPPRVGDQPPVPEPASLLLLGSGLVGLAARLRRT